MNADFRASVAVNSSLVVWGLILIFCAIWWVGAWTIGLEIVRGIRWGLGW